MQPRSNWAAWASWPFALNAPKPIIAIKANVASAIRIRIANLPMAHSVPLWSQVRDAAAGSAWAEA